MAVTETELAAAIAAVAASKGSAAWLPVLATGVLTSVVAIATLIGNHNLTRYRDQENLRLKAEQEEKGEAARRLTMMRFICSELIFVIEDFALRCHDEMFESSIDATDPATWPKLSLSGIGRDWAVLPPDVLYELQELPVVYRAALRQNAYTVQHNIGRIRPDMLKAPHAEAGLKAVELAIRLRRECGFPESSLTSTILSVQDTLQEQHDICRRSVIPGNDYLQHQTTATLIPDATVVSAPSPRLTPKKGR